MNSFVLKRAIFIFQVFRYLAFLSVSTSPYPRPRT